MSIQKKTVTAKTRKLSANWKVEMSPNDFFQVETDLLDELAKTIQEEIDYEVMCDMLVVTGWHKVVLSGMDNITLYEIQKWIDTEAKGKVESRGGPIWIFEKAEDAEWFTLKWA